MNNITFCNDIKNYIKNEKFCNGNIKIGYLRNDIFRYDINNHDFESFKKFLAFKIQSTNYKQKIYQYYDLILISKDENSHICFKEKYHNLVYYTPFDNKLSLRFKVKKNIIVDNIQFPCIEKYHNFENQEIERYSIKFKNSIIDIDFIKYDNIKTIEFSFNVDINNFEDFKNNLSYILSKLYRNKITL